MIFTLKFHSTMVRSDLQPSILVNGNGNKAHAKFAPNDRQDLKFYRRQIKDLARLRNQDVQEFSVCLQTYLLRLSSFRASRRIGAAALHQDHLSDASIFASSQDMWTHHKSSWNVLLHAFLEQPLLCVPLTADQCIAMLECLWLGKRKM